MQGKRANNPYNPHTPWLKSVTEGYGLGEVREVRLYLHLFLEPVPTPNHIRKSAAAPFRPTTPKKKTTVVLWQPIGTLQLDPWVG